MWKMLNDMKREPEMIIMMGLPASGKNTWLMNKNVKQHIVVELDWIRREIFGHQFHKPAEMFVIGMAKNITQMLLSQQKSIIINSTGLTTGIRNEWALMAQEYGYKTKIVFIDTPVEMCHKRNNNRIHYKVPSEVIDRMSAILTRPDNNLMIGCDLADKIVVVKS